MQLLLIEGFHRKVDRLREFEDFPEEFVFLPLDQFYLEEFLEYQNQQYLDITLEAIHPS